jgi:hypothetical protein
VTLPPLVLPGFAITNFLKKLLRKKLGKINFQEFWQIRTKVKASLKQLLTGLKVASQDTGMIDKTGACKELISLCGHLALPRNVGLG